MDLAAWRDIALVLLILEAFIMALIPGVIVYALLRGLNMGLRWLRQTGFPQLHHYSHLVNTESKRYAAKVTAPVIQADSGATQARRTVNAFFARLYQR